MENRIHNDITIEDKSQQPNKIKYVCNVCQYETETKGSYLRHELSEKHKNNLKHAPNLRKKTGSLDCVNCGKTFLHKSGLSRHKSSCIHNPLIKTQNNNKYKQMCKDKDKLIEQLRKEIDQITMEKEQIAIEKDNATKMVGTLVIHGKCYDTPQREPTTSNYLTVVYNSAPALKALQQRNVSDFWKDDEDPELSLVDILSSAYNRNKLIEFIGVTLLAHYKKQDPSEQSVWNTDTERLSYYIKEHVGWCVDKKGELAAKLMIDPSLNYFKGVLSHCLSINPKRNRHTLSDHDKRVTCFNIFNDIKDGVTQKQLLKFMAPYLHLNKEKEMKALNDAYRKCLVEY